MQELNRLHSGVINVTTIRHARPRIVAIIEARMSSSRLPGKVLMMSCEKSMLEIMCSRLDQCEYIDEIVVATTVNESDNLIVAECNRIGVSHFRGDEENVLARVVEATKHARAEVVVSLTADCPLIDSYIIKQCVENFLEQDVDYYSNCHIRSFPDGMDTQVIKARVLIQSLSKASSNLELEHVTLNIRQNLQKYSSGILTASKSQRWPELGLTLDEKTDFEVIDKVLVNFSPRLDFTCEEIIEFLRENPEIVQLNSSVVRKGDN